MRESNLIRPAKISQWGFPTVFVNKPDSNKIQKPNDKTILQPYPMLNMNYLLADIEKRPCRCVSLTDLSDRQIPLSNRFQQIATMSTIVGDFSQTTCIFRLKNLPFVFTKLMDKIFSLIRGIFMEFFPCDMIINSSPFV